MCFSFISRPQPQIAVGYTPHTNCIVTLYWADGVCRTRPVLFTTDSRFKMEQKKTERGFKISSNLKNRLAEYSLSVNQIHYLEGSKKYVPESKDILRAFLKRCDLHESCVIFSDMGNAFFENGKPIIDNEFNHRTEQYYPIVHHCLSPNDNKIHGVAKQIWRREELKNGWDQSQSVESDTCLLGALTHVDPDLVRECFRKNFLLDSKEVPSETCRRNVSGVSEKFLKKLEKLQDCQREYLKYIRLKDKMEDMPTAETHPEMVGGLDGTYWKKKRKIICSKLFVNRRNINKAQRWSFPGKI